MLFYCLEEVECCHPKLSLAIPAGYYAFVERSAKQFLRIRVLKLAKRFLSDVHPANGRVLPALDRVASHIT